MARKIDGRLADKYQLLAVLGQGATGTVYAAKDLHTQQRIAIKYLHLRPGLDPGSAEIFRFEQEARIAGSIASPHIAQVLDIAHDPETDLPFLVMELLQGEDLQSFIDRVGALQVDVALRIAAQACAGLASAHAAGVVHRDIKPANLFLARQENGQIVVKILDFGIAKIRPVPDPSASSQRLPAPAMSMTKTGQMLGSPLFMSPEQVDGTKHVDGRSDLFSLAVTLFTMLVGKAPHAGVKSFLMLLSRLVTVAPPPLGTIAEWIPPAVEAFVLKASALNRDNRFSSAKEMLAALETLLPEGTDLRQDMLVGLGDARPATDKAPIGTDPYGQTDQTSAQGDSWMSAITVSTVAAKGAAEPTAAMMAETLPNAILSPEKPPEEVPLAATMQIATPLAAVEPNVLPTPPRTTNAPSRNAAIVGVAVVVIALVAILISLVR